MQYNYSYSNLKKLVLTTLILLLGMQLTYSMEGAGYFGVSNSSQFLNFSNMSKEFAITSIMNSAIANDAKATQIFISSGANVNDKNIAGVTALHLATRNNSLETAQILINSGANVNARDLEGWTPLMRASLAGNPKMIKLLMENGAIVWAQNNFGETALIHAAMADCYECGQLLLEKQDASNYLINDQKYKSKEIVTKRYNEPFIQLLSNTNNRTIATTIGNNSADDNVAMSRLVYIFTGKTVGNEQMKKISKSNYDISKEQEKKLNALKPKTIVIDFDAEDAQISATPQQSSRQIPIKQQSYSFAGMEKSLQNQNFSTIPQDKAKNQTIFKSKAQTKQLELIEQKTNKPKFVLEPTIATPVIESKSEKPTITKTTFIKEKPKFILDPTLAKPVIEEKQPIKVKNMVVEERPKFILNPAGPVPKTVALEEKPKFVLDPTLTKPVIEKKKSIQTKNILVEEQPKFVLNPTLAKPVIEEEKPKFVLDKKAPPKINGKLVPVPVEKPIYE